jgi:tRNA (adenine22-N1)-methyltransferase
VKLTKRLAALAEHVQRPYLSIWDCCCDHGLLGMAILQKKHAQQVHFVDCITSITDQLKATLAESIPSSENYFVHNIDVQNLPLELLVTEEGDPGSQENKLDSLQQPHLIIIAGVGGELTLELVQHLTEKFSYLNLEFLICPVRHTYQLRQGLKKSVLNLMNETLIQENRRFYEILHLANYHQPNIETYDIEGCGSKLWQPFGHVQVTYLDNQISHWERVLNNTQLDNTKYKIAKASLQDYQLIKLANTLSFVE